MTTAPSLPIDRLLRGIATEDVATARDAWRELLENGEASVAAVRAKLASGAWAYNVRGPLPRYLGTLLVLLDELDADAFREEIDRLLETCLHPLHRKTVEILAHRCHDRPAAVVGPELRLYVADDIADRAAVVGGVQRWCRTEGLELRGVTRIDVIARHPQLDYLGRYNRFFSGIILTWPAGQARGPRAWWRQLRAEFTFYHEVGHHACGHVEAGQVADQEAEADAYAQEMMRRSHPILTGLLRPVAAVLKLLLRSVPAGTGSRQGEPS